jgi:hypothetical protein
MYARLGCVYAISKFILRHYVITAILAVSVSEPLRENSELFAFMALKEILNIRNI